MTSRTAAIRYARALFDVALKEGGSASVDQTLQAIEGQLAGFADLLQHHDLLAKVLFNPAVPSPRKRSAVAELLKRVSVSPVVGKLLLLLAERDRLVLLPELLEAYRDRLLVHQKVVRAQVTTASALAPDRAQAIERDLARATGRQVRLVTAVDPSIIGGLVTRIGSTVYDGSITGQLARMRQKLASDR